MAAINNTLHKQNITDCNKVDKDDKGFKEFQIAFGKRDHTQFKKWLDSGRDINSYFSKLSGNPTSYHILLACVWELDYRIFTLFLEKGFKLPEDAIAKLESALQARVTYLFKERIASAQMLLADKSACEKLWTEVDSAIGFLNLTWVFQAILQEALQNTLDAHLIAEQIRLQKYIASALPTLPSTLISLIGVYADTSKKKYTYQSQKAVKIYGKDGRDVLKGIGIGYASASEAGEANDSYKNNNILFTLIDYCRW